MHLKYYDMEAVKELNQRFFFRIIRTPKKIATKYIMEKSCDILKRLRMN
jgi:hypothetical protein